jgi:hypothetical protein
LARLITEETGGKILATGLEDSKTAKIAEALASHLGNFIALQCGDNTKVMSDFLDGISNYMCECAADTQKSGVFEILKRARGARSRHGR